MSISSKRKTSRAGRIRRHRRIRKTVFGTAQRPRLAVFRSNQHIYAQAIDDEAGRTVVAASDVESDLRGQDGSKTEHARAVGRLVARRLKDAGIEQVVFDRGGFMYHGRVAALAEAAREEGLVF